VVTRRAAVPRVEHDLYDVLKDELAKAKEPLDCATLFDKASVRKHANTVNRVSDYLGNLWRQGKVVRLPAPRLEGSRARWLYALKPPGKKPKPDLAQAIEYHGKTEMVLSRPYVEITEEGDAIVITMPKMTITIRQKE
jgi:hypothetical protein